MHAVVTSPLLMAGGVLVALVLGGVGVAQTVVSAHACHMMLENRETLIIQLMICQTMLNRIHDYEYVHRSHTKHMYLYMQFNSKVSHDPVTTWQLCNFSFCHMHGISAA